MRIYTQNSWPIPSSAEVPNEAQRAALAHTCSRYLRQALRLAPDSEPDLSTRIDYTLRRTRMPEYIVYHALWLVAQLQQQFPMMRGASAYLKNPLIHSTPNNS